MWHIASGKALGEQRGAKRNWRRGLGFRGWGCQIVEIVIAAVQRGGWRKGAKATKPGCVA